MKLAKIFLILLLASRLFPPATAEAFNCDVSATAVNFGGYDVLSPTPNDAVATITVSCNIPPQNPQAPLAVKISVSPGSSGSFFPRRVPPLGGGAGRAYNLFTGPTFSTVWGDGTGGSATQTNFVTRATPWTATIYGRIPPRQNVSAGSYGDALTVTIEW